MPGDLVLRAVLLGAPGSPLPDGTPTPGELERAAALVDAVQRHRFLAGRLALRALVADFLGVDPCEVRPAYTCPECGIGEHGRPGFVLAHDGAPLGALGRSRRLPIAASMSRAGEWALVAADTSRSESKLVPSDLEARPGDAGVGRGMGIGVDLVRVADVRGAIPDAALTPAERRRVSAAADPAAEAARLWARKEAVLKALGTGLRTDPASVDALGDRRVSDIDARSLELPEGFVASLARPTL